jgi:hypothetical protein
VGTTDGTIWIYTCSITGKYYIKIRTNSEAKYRKFSIIQGNGREKGMDNPKSWLT